MKKMPDSVLLASGGLDSTVLAYWLADRGESFVPLFIDYGQHCRDTELKRLRRCVDAKMLESLEVLDLSKVYEASTSRMVCEADLWRDEVAADDLYLPYRNMMFLSVAAAFAQARNLRFVYSAFINSNHAKEIDCSAEFFGRLEGIFENYGGVEIRMPFREMSKTQVARIGVDLGVNIGQTFSCQVSSTVPCGACPNCVDRNMALENVSRPDL